MGVDYFWKRAPAETISGMTPKDLAGLVPYWFDDELEGLLGMGATGTSWEPAARAFCSRLPDWNDHWMVGARSHRRWSA